MVRTLLAIVICLTVALGISTASAQTITGTPGVFTVQTPTGPVNTPLTVGAAPSATKVVIGNSLDTITSSFNAVVDVFGTRLAAYARNIMSALVVIEFIFTIGQIVMTGGDLGEMLKALLMRMLIVGGFIWLTDVIPAAGGLADWVSSFASSLFNAATAGSAAKVTPGSILTYCWNAGSAAYDAASGVATIGAVFVLVIDIAVGAVLAGELIIVYVEIHIVFAAAIAALGFAPWSQTRGIARNVLFSTIGAAFKLFGMLLIGAVVTNLLKSYSDTNLAGAPVKAGALVAAQMIVLALISTKVPKALESAVMSGAIQASGSGVVASAVGSFAGSALGTAAGAAWSGARGLYGSVAGAGAGEQASASKAPTPGQNSEQAAAFAAPLAGMSNTPGSSPSNSNTNTGGTA